ncbi:MAG: hypothetical protein ABSE90_12800 [Verrucomicrobiota bacterium]
MCKFSQPIPVRGVSAHRADASCGVAPPGKIRNLVARLFGVRYFWGMTEIETQLLQTLHQLEKAAEAMPAAHSKADVRPLFARVDELAKQLPASADPQLRHFLQRKSYEKARLFLQGCAGH